MPTGSSVCSPGAPTSRRAATARVSRWPRARPRLARIAGRDRAEAPAPAWAALAAHFAEAQLRLLHDAAALLLGRPDMDAQAPLIPCGAGAFLGPRLADRLGRASVPLVDLLGERIGRPARRDLDLWAGGGGRPHRRGGDNRMSAIKILARILTVRVGPHIELAVETETGEVLKVLATEDQIDRLVDELDDILNSPAAPDGDGPPEAA